MEVATGQALTCCDLGIISKQDLRSGCMILEPDCLGVHVVFTVLLDLIALSEMQLQQKKQI